VGSDVGRGGRRGGGGHGDGDGGEEEGTRKTFRVGTDQQ